VYLVSKVGNDQFGQIVKENLTAHNVRTDFVYTAEAKTTGIIVTLVSAKGENATCIAPGANRALRPADITTQAAEQLISSADVCLIHGDLPPDTVVAAIRTANLHKTRAILDPAGALSNFDLPQEYFSVNILIPNVQEAADLAEGATDSIHEGKLIGSDLVARGVECAVIKMGKRGCIIVDRTGAEHIPAFPVELVDQTCCGDAFAGALAASVGAADNIKQAVRFACAAGALACTKFGAQDSLPKKEEIIQLLQQME
jgi:ribokinase